MIDGSNLVPLQQGICDSSKTFADYLTAFEFIKAPVCTYADPLGWLVMGLLVYGSVVMSIYIRTNSLIIPTVLVLLLGEVVLVQVAAVANPFVILLLTGVPAGLVAIAYYLYSR